MQTAVRYELGDVETALTNLGTSLPILQEAVKAGYLARISRTANDAPNAAGIYQWNDTLRSLRENMALRAWQRSNIGNWPTTVHPEKFLAIAVASGNQNTGRRGAVPSTKTPKGPRTVNAVNANQLWLPGLEPLHSDVEQAKYPTWFLLFFADEAELRAELSLPIGMDEDGHVSGWRERIILPPEPLDPRISLPEPDFGPDIDIKISKKG